VIGDILQPTHLLLILVVALLVLGPKRLPEAGRALGRGLRDFKDAVSGVSLDEHNDLLGPTTSAPTATPVPTVAPAPTVTPAPTATHEAPKPPAEPVEPASQR
jgi:sec-independent protein translocase protein TatA